MERAARPVTVYRFDVGPGLGPGRRSGSRWSARRAPTSGCWPPTWGPLWAAGAHLRNLRRTRIGSFSTEDARLVDELTPAVVLTPAQALRDLDQVVVPDAVRTLVARGLALDRVPLGVTGDGPWGLVDRGTGCWPCTRPPRPTGSGRPWCSRRPDEAGGRPRDRGPAPVAGVTAVTFHGDGDRDRAVDLHAPGRGQRRDHRRLRRRPPRPSGPARRAAGPGPGGRSLHHRGHLRPPPGHRGAPRVGAQAPLRPRSEARNARIGGSGADGGRPLRRGAGQRDGGGFRAGRAHRRARSRLVVVGEDFHFGHGRKGNVALLREMGSEAGFAVEGVALRADGDAAGARRPSPSRRPGSATWSARAGWRRRPCCWAGPTRSGARWCTATTGAAPSSASPRPTSTYPTASACRRPGSTPAGTSGRTDRPARRPSRSGRRPTFYGDGGDLLVEAYRPRLRPATSTARRRRCPSCPGSATSRLSSTSRSSSSRWSGTWPPPGRGCGEPG